RFKTFVPFARFVVKMRTRTGRDSRHPGVGYSLRYLRADCCDSQVDRNKPGWPGAAFRPVLIPMMERGRSTVFSAAPLEALLSVKGFIKTRNIHRLEISKDGFTVE
ncbi:MAG: hypothetical protein ACPGIC_06475, partial [Opitutales bacterium]